MSQIRITGLSRWFGSGGRVRAADDLSLTVEKGEFLVLLGPSGCGKTTTLRCLAGLETPDRGSIDFAGRRVFDHAAGIDLAPDKRNIGMVFQSYALWPHMTVRQNIEYPLRARGLKQGLSEDWALETARLVECEALLERYPSQLSGGQQQRIAVARGLAARPDLMLFDEPLSNLDARLRDQVRSHIHELHSRLKFTAVFVTHDQAEALALGTRLAVMNRGRIEQLDTARQVFEKPGSEYVANFMGMSNRFALSRAEGAWRCGGASVTGVPERFNGHGGIIVRVREQDLTVLPDGAAAAPSGSVGLPAEVIDASYGGRHLDVAVRAGGERFYAQCPADRIIAPGQAVTLQFPSSAAAFYTESGERVELQAGLGTAL